MSGRSSQVLRRDTGGGRLAGPRERRRVGAGRWRRISLLAAALALPAALASPSVASASRSEPTYLAGRPTAAAIVSARAPSTVAATAEQTTPDLELRYTAATSDTDTCSGMCDEDELGLADWTTYSRTVRAKLDGEDKFADYDMLVQANSGQLDEDTEGWSASGDFTEMSVANCGEGSGSGTEELQGAATPGTIEVHDILFEKTSGGKMEMLVPVSEGVSTEKTHVTVDGACPLSFNTSEITASEDALDVNEAKGVAALVNGWKIKGHEEWLPEDGVLATRTLSDSVPQPTYGGPDVGTQSVAETWDLVTCPEAKDKAALVVCIANLAVDGLPLPGWDGGPIPYSWGGGKDPHPPGPSLGSCEGYDGPDKSHCKTYKKGPEFTVGLDCAGFSRWVFYLAYDRDVLGGGNNISQTKRPGVHTTDHPKPGDLVFFKNKDGVFDHIGIVVARGLMASEPGTGGFAHVTSIPKGAYYYAYD
jgi:NlpC/P60 family